MATYHLRASGTIAIRFVQCTAAASAHKFTIPARFWRAPCLRYGGRAERVSEGWIQIGQYNTPTHSAPRADPRIITDIFYNGLGVYFK